MNLKSKIDNAKYCVGQLSSKYVKAVTYGVDTEDLFNSLVLMYGYIKALENYDCHPTKKVNVTTFLTYNDFLLTDNDKSLSLGSTCEVIDLDPAEVNCLTQDEVCVILEQIHLLCDACSCGC